MTFDLDLGQENWEYGVSAPPHRRYSWAIVDPTDRSAKQAARKTLVLVNLKDLAGPTSKRSSATEYSKLWNCDFKKAS